MNTMENAAHVRLELSSRAESVSVVRQALGGLADATGLSPADLVDIGTAVTEACNNASAHAYGGSEGPLEVELLAERDGMVVTVRDRGVGLALAGGAPVEFPTDVDGELAGLGLPSILGLATNVRWREPHGGGTEVEMTFATCPLAWESAGRELEEGADRELELLDDPPTIKPAGLANTIEVEFAPPALARGVLPRLLRAMAARAHFSVARHADIQRVCSVLLGNSSTWSSAGRIPAGRIQVRLVAGIGSLELAIGPIAADDATRMASAARAIEPGLRTRMARMDDGPPRLVLNFLARGAP